tara:strand:- start:493 stop:792 length:300 start_codon:yes stop_codon:yes gene_type:complete
MDISELKGTVLQRFQELTDEEAGILQSLEQHPVGEVIMKLIGPELTEIFSEPEGETEQMLADMPRAPMEDTRDTMYSAGPNTEEYRVDPMTYRNTPDIP